MVPVGHLVTPYALHTGLIPRSRQIWRHWRTVWERYGIRGHWSQEIGHPDFPYRTTPRSTSPTLKTPRRHLLPSDPPRAPPSQALAQRVPDLALLKGGAGRERRGRNLRPLPQPMDGSNTAIVRVFQEGTGIEREQGQGLFTKKSLACSTPPGTCFPSLMTTPQPY